LGDTQFLVIGLEGVNVGDRLGNRFGLGQPLAPGFLVDSAHNQVVIADDGWIVLTEHLGQQVFQLVFVADEQVARFAVATGIVEGDQVVRLNVDEQRDFALPGFGATEGAAGQALVRIGIEDEVVQLRRVVGRCSWIGCHVP